MEGPDGGLEPLLWVAFYKPPDGSDCHGDPVAMLIIGWF